MHGRKVAVGVARDIGFAEQQLLRNLHKARIWIGRTLDRRLNANYGVLMYRPAIVSTATASASAFRVKNREYKISVAISVPAPVDVVFAIAIVAVAHKTVARAPRCHGIIDYGATIGEFVIHLLIPLVDGIVVAEQITNALVVLEAA